MFQEIKSRLNMHRYTFSVGWSFQCQNFDLKFWPSQACVSVLFQFYLIVEHSQTPSFISHLTIKQYSSGQRQNQAEKDHITEYQSAPHSTPWSQVENHWFTLTPKDTVRLHEIFDFWFFSSIKPTRSPDSWPKFVSNIKPIPLRYWTNLNLTACILNTTWKNYFSQDTVR